MSCLIVQEDTCFQLNNFCLVVKSYLGKFTDIDYYKVIIQETRPNTNLESSKFGLLRIGDINGGLSRELQLRHVLGENPILSELLAFSVEAIDLFGSIENEQALENNVDYSQVTINKSNSKDCVIENNTKSSDREILKSHTTQLINQENELTDTESYSNEDWESTEDYDYLEDDRIADTNFLSNSKLLLLSDLPNPEKTLDIWLQKKHNYEVSLALTHQICQLFQQSNQQGWCFFQIIPQFIQVDADIKFFDLTNVSLIGEKVIYGIENSYCAPELAFDYPIREGMSSYIIGILLYQAIYQQLPDTKLSSNYLNIQPIPGIYQIISLCLAPVIEERISLIQLLKALSETQQTFSSCKVQWEVASRSTIGLSLQRLHNEDNYGVQQYSSSSEDGILAVLADGMGGLAQGEIASQLAVKTVIKTLIDYADYSDSQGNEWLISVVQQANKYVRENVNKGGTTLSIVWVNSRHLRIAHVGDSRIYLIRKQRICQLSEDHSLVAMLLADGNITYEESHKHPQRNILTKCIGSKENLDSSHIQTLQSFGSDLSIFLEQDDIIILCSDGVWDLVSPGELAEFFVINCPLKIAVDNTINLVLTRGARDNATIIAMKCNLLNQY